MRPNYLPPGNRPLVAAAYPLQSPPRASSRWFTRPMVLLFVLIPVPLILAARTSDAAGLLFAYVNVLVMGLAMIRFVRQRTFEAMVPGTFLIYTICCFSLSSIYFAICDPDAGYGTMTKEVRRYLDGNLRVQAVTLLYVLGYLTTIFFVGPRAKRTIPTFSSRNLATKRLAYVALAISMVALAGGLYARVTDTFTSLFGYIISGLFNYLYAIPLIIGVLYPKIPRIVRMTALAFFAVTSSVYLVYHSRFNMLVPWIAMAIGLLFFSEWPQRKKVALTIFIAVSLPLMLVIGEVTRIKGKAWTGSTEERMEALSHWKEVLSEGSVLGQTMGRIFSTGGHSIITLSPERVEYMDFDPGKYVLELATTIFVPGRLYTNSYYSTSYNLNRYGLRVGETTSVELSSVGGLWMIGGWLAVLVGSIWFGLMHSGLMHWLRSATRKSAYQGLFYLGLILPTLMAGFTTELMNHTRTVIRVFLAGVLLWHLIVRPILGRWAMSKEGLPARRLPFLSGFRPTMLTTIHKS